MAIGLFCEAIFFSVLGIFLIWNGLRMWRHDSPWIEEIVDWYQAHQDRWDVKLNYRGEFSRDKIRRGARVGALMQVPLGVLAMVIAVPIFIKAF